jgi:putative hydrolase of the HAD superfamily
VTDHDAPLESLVAGVELLSLDAGNTIIFLDHGKLSSLLAEHGIEASVASLVEQEGFAKRAIEDDTLTTVAWAHEHAPGARGWGRYIGTIAARAGAPVARLPALLEAFWASHCEKNLYHVVPDGLAAAVDELRAHGVPVVVVSNSEGGLATLFDQLGITRHFDLLLDSAKLGVEKPEPGIWQFALRAYPASAPDKVLHLGDTFATDIVGAQRLGFRAALIDPYSHYEGRHAAIPRVTSVAEVARAIVRSASRHRPRP